MLENVEVLCHSSIKIAQEKVIYFDPFKITENAHDADIIFITHDHYDHYSEEDIEQIKKEDTMMIVPEGLFSKVVKNGFREENVISVVPNQTYEVAGISFETVPAYNLMKPFHPKKKAWVGYIVNLQGIRYYIAGDTDRTEDNEKVKCDVAFVPVGGTYTMNFKAAAQLVNCIQPKIAVPIHYGSVVGTQKDAEEFLKLLNPEIEGKIWMK